MLRTPMRSAWRQAQLLPTGGRTVVGRVVPAVGALARRSSNNTMLSASVRPVFEQQTTTATATAAAAKPRKRSKKSILLEIFIIIVTLGLVHATEQLEGSAFEVLDSVFKGDAGEPSVAVNAKLKRKQLKHKFHSGSESRDAVMEYYDSGSGWPVVVLNSSSKNWSLPLHVAISKFTRCISFDHVGVGGSVGPIVTSADAMLNEVSTLLNECKVDKPIILVSMGHNWLWTARSAARNSAHVAGLVMVEPIVPVLPVMFAETTLGIDARCRALMGDTERLGYEVENGVFYVLSKLFGPNPHLLTPTKIHGIITPGDVLREQIFAHAVLYHRSLRLPFQMHDVAMNFEGLLVSLVARGSNNAAWQTIASELSLFDTEFAAVVALQATANRAVMQGVKPVSVLVPESVPVCIIGSSFDSAFFDKSKRNIKDSQLRQAFSSTTSLNLVGLVKISHTAPAHVQELIARVQLTNYRSLRNTMMKQLFPHSKLLSYNPTDIKQVPGIDPALVAREVQKLVTNARESAAAAAAGAPKSK